MPEALRFWILKWFVLAIDSAEIVQGQFMYSSICAVLNYPIVIYRTRSFLCNIPSIYNIGDFLLGIISYTECSGGAQLPCGQVVPLKADF
jgi:hypothetical protein